MTRLDKSISLTRANLLATVMLVPLLGIFVPLFIALWGADAINTRHIGTGLSLAAFVVGVVVHEALHGLTWQMLSGKWGTVEYGIKWRTLTPYAHLKARIPAGIYRVGVWMPGAVVGVLPLVIGLAIGNSALFWFGLMFTWAAGGDAMVLWLLRDVPHDALVEDHPEQAGCYVYTDTSIAA